MIRKYSLFYTAVILLALGLRIYSLNHGLPYLVAPDEKRQVLDALSMGAKHTLIPLDYTYPALHKYLLLSWFGSYFFISYIFGMFSNLADFTFKFLLNPGYIFFLGRLLSVILGMALIIPAYLTGRNFFSKKVGIISAIFTMFMYNLAVHSQWAVSDILLTFCSAWAFYFILQSMLIGRIRHFIFTGAFIGLSFATKYQGAYLIVPFLIIMIVQYKNNIFRKEAQQRFFLAFLIMAIFILIGNLGFILNFKEGLARLIELKNETMGISSLQPFNHNFASVVAWFIKELIRQEKALGIILTLGIFYAIYKHSKTDLVFLSYLLVCLFSLINFGFRFLHLLVYVFPVMCVFAARFGQDFMEVVFKNKYNFSHSLILATIIVIPSISNVVISDIKHSNPDTRLLTKNWIEQNIPPGSNIAEDWYDFSVPLHTEVPFIFQDEKIRPYYVNYLSGPMRQRYQNYTNNQKKYNLIQIRYETKEPTWPGDMPEEAIKRSENIPLVKRLYRWFNFYSINELRKMGVSYVIISSYSYNHFLLDDDPRKKTGLFNPHLLEDTLYSNRQAKSYDKNSKYGLLFYLAKRVRDFYLPLLNLDKQNNQIKLIKEIYPDNWHLGPVIKIYKLN